MKKLKDFYNLLKAKLQNVSSIENTPNNFDNKGNFIGDLPTITTNFCEIGFYDKNLIYFTFIIESKSFNTNVFSLLKNKTNVNIYPFANFKQTLYPINNFNYIIFLEQITKEKYLQIQFDFKDNIKVEDLYIEYCKLLKIFTKTKIKLVDQLKIDCTRLV